MRSLNKVMLIGNLGNDPEIRHTPGGAAVATFRMATTWTFTDQGGNRQERTEWHRIVAWRKLAEICQQYLRKGRQVYIEGRLQTREWEDKQSGQRRWTTEVVAEEMIMLGGRGEGGQREEARVPAYAEERASGSTGSRGADEADGGYTPDSSLDPVGEDEDLPF
ncbi:MAG: single-stranded DNA-binding protein [Candidatus Eisenbacteria bacterium]|uniref:Single-stranded DNA-binding protein n=1 Tax=Eiseniibacteriota bacterium TaxID=2212470 RepID=A0A938BRA9_UNCEI|nr:single-stranded DNA-binding protein [Candidatus Eisenbacteria bacterium]